MDTTIHKEHRCLITGNVYVCVYILGKVETNCSLTSTFCAQIWIFYMSIMVLMASQYFPICEVRFIIAYINTRTMLHVVSFFNIQKNWAEKLKNVLNYMATSYQNFFTDIRNNVYQIFHYMNWRNTNLGRLNNEQFELKQKKLWTIIEASKTHVTNILFLSILKFLKENGKGSDATFSLLKKAIGKTIYLFNSFMKKMPIRVSRFF